MILDLNELPPQQTTLDTDVCVVGAGAVGLLLAVELARQGLSVLLMEGGGASLEPASQALQQGQSIGHPFGNIGVGRYRVLGGSTLYWGGQVIPFDAHVTEQRPWLGHGAWPISAAELAGLFKRVYQSLGFSDALLNDADVWAALGQQEPELGSTLRIEFTRWVKVRNLAKLYRRELQDKSGRLTTLVHANVTALTMQRDDAQVQSAVVRSLKGRQLEVRARQFVLANGTLEIARLMMHPLSDGREAPWASFPMLGRPLIDHLDCVAGQVRPRDARAFGNLFDSVFLGGFKYYPKIRLSPTTQREGGHVDIAAQFLYKSKFTEHLEYIKMFLRSVKDGTDAVSVWALPRHLAAVVATTIPLAVRYFRERRSFKPHDAEVSLALYCEQLPCNASKVALSNEVDDLGMRKLVVDWQIDGRELGSMQVLAKEVKQSLESAGLADVEIDPLLASGDPEFLSKVHDAIHQMGVARIGGSAADGVVDANLKVFGTDNLFIAGAAVFPSTGYANPTFTAMALAMRLADHLVETSSCRS